MVILIIHVAHLVLKSSQQTKLAQQTPPSLLAGCCAITLWQL